jgi:N-acetylmuramoyl-L-alanine amidase
VVYKVQITISANIIPDDSEIFNGLEVDNYIDNGIYKYTIGNEPDIQSCISLKDLAVEKGFSDAFIIAFHNSKRITLDEARRIKKIN